MKRREPVKHHGGDRILDQVARTGWIPTTTRFQTAKKRCKLLTISEEARHPPLCTSRSIAYSLCTASVRISFEASAEATMTSLTSTDWAKGQF